VILAAGFFVGLATWTTIEVVGDLSVPVEPWTFPTEPTVVALVAPQAPPVRRGTPRSEPDADATVVITPAPNPGHRPIGAAPGTSKGGNAGTPMGEGPAPNGTSHGEGAGLAGPRVVHHTALTVLTRTLPRFPKIAKSLGIVDGRCVARMSIDLDGRPLEVTVAGCPAALHAETVRSLSKWLFAPYLINGIPVPTATRIIVNYKLRSRKGRD
jgi:hypothetical protein